MTRPETSPRVRVPEAIDAAAAMWFARHDAGLDATGEAEFARWLAADSLHALAWADYAALATSLAGQRESGTAADLVRELTARRRRRRWRVLTGMSAGLAAAAAAIVLLLARPAVPLAVELESTPGGSPAVVVRPERQVLPDGSVVEFNAGAAIAVNYLPERREVRLVRGEAHFDVEKNPARPFVVLVGPVRVRAVGTAFAVKLAPQAVDVVVTEGRVAVDHAVPASVAAGDAHVPAVAAVFASAGESVVMPLVVDAVATAPSFPPAVALSPVETEQRLGWRGPKVELSGTPLAEAVVVFNRENRVQLAIADAALAQRRMSGLFKVDNAEGFVRLLESHYGVQTERRPDGVIVLRQK